MSETSRRYNKRPTANVITPNGSVVFWATASRRGTPEKMYVRIHCGGCRKDRWCPTSNTMHGIRTGTFNGFCNPCFLKRPWVARGQPRPSGQRWTTKTGYVLVYAPEHRQATPSGKVFEHRMVMSDLLGRQLKRTEHVHHKNGRRDDNRPENLVLLEGNVHWLVTQLEQRVGALESLLLLHGVKLP